MLKQSKFTELMSHLLKQQILFKITYFISSMVITDIEEQTKYEYLLEIILKDDLFQYSIDSFFNILNKNIQVFFSFLTLMVFVQFVGILVAGNIPNCVKCCSLHLQPLPGVLYWSCQLYLITIRIHYVLISLDIIDVCSLIKFSS